MNTFSKIKILVFFGFAFIACTQPVPVPKFEAKVLQQYQQQLLYATQNNKVDEALFFVDKPLDFVEQRLTKFYHYKKAPKTQAKQLIKQYIQPELNELTKALGRKSNKARSDEEKNKIFQSLFDTQTVYVAPSHLLVCMGQQQNIFLMLLVYPDNARHNYAQCLKEAAMKTGLLRRTTPVTSSDPHFITTGFNDQKEHFTNERFRDRMVLAKRTVSEAKPVAVLTVLSEHLIPTLKKRLYQKKNPGKRKQKKDYSPTSEKVPANGNFIRAYSPQTRFNYNSPKKPTIFHNCLNVIYYESLNTTYEEHQEIQLKATGGQIVYQEAGKVYFFSRSPKELVLEFSLPSRNISQVIRYKPQPVTNHTLEIIFDKKNAQGKFSALASRFPDENYRRENSREFFLPKQLYISTNFRKKRGKYETAYSFFAEEHLLDHKLMPGKWQVHLKRNNRIIYTQTVEKSDSIYLENIRQKAKDQDSLIVELTQVRRINYLNESVKLPLSSPRRFGFLIHLPLPPLPLLAFDLTSSSEKIFEQSKPGTGEATHFRKWLNNKKAHLPYQTWRRNIAKVRIKNNGKGFLTFDNTNSFLEWRTFFESDASLKSFTTVKKFSKLFLKSWQGSDFKKVKKKFYQFLKTFGQHNPLWKITKEMQEKHPDKGFDEVFNAMIDFKKLFLSRQERRSLQGYRANTNNNYYSYDFPYLERDGYYIKLYLAYNKGKGTFRARVYLAAK